MKVRRISRPFDIEKSRLTALLFNCFQQWGLVIAGLAGSSLFSSPVRYFSFETPNLFVLIRFVDINRPPERVRLATAIASRRRISVSPRFFSQTTFSH